MSRGISWPYINFSMRPLMNKCTILSSQLNFSSSKCQLMKQNLVYYASQQFCYEILSWMVGIRMNDHLINDNNYNIVYL